MAFQAELQVECALGFVARSDLTGHDFDNDDEDLDRRVGDLHYPDVCELAVGHNVSVTADPMQGARVIVGTAWLPTAYVPRVAPGESVQGVELGMEPDLAAELAARGVRIDPSNLSRWFIRNGYRFKKTLLASEQDRPDIREAREHWVDKRQPKMRMQAHRLVFVDETGTTTKMTRLRLPEVSYGPRALAPGDQSRASLHARCVVVDGHTALVGSANLTEAAQLRNIELGLVVRAETVAAGIEKHFHALIQRGFLRRLAFA